MGLENGSGTGCRAEVKITRDNIYIVNDSFIMDQYRSDTGRDWKLRIMTYGTTSYPGVRDPHSRVNTLKIHVPAHGGKVVFVTNRRSTVELRMLGKDELGVIKVGIDSGTRAFSFEELPLQDPDAALWYVRRASQARARRGSQPAPSS